MKVSVIVPVYNCEKYLDLCLESIVTQTYHDLEIIIIDDGSTDNSTKIVDKFQHRDSRIKVIRTSNHGVSAARNLGLKLSKGEYISFVDSDDTLEKDFYECLIPLFSDCKVDIVHCGYNRVMNGETKKIFGTRKTLKLTSEESVKCLLLGREFNTALWNKIYRKKILLGLEFQNDLKNNEDTLFNYLAFSRSTYSIFYDICKYNYNVRKDSACNSTPIDKIYQDYCLVNKTIYLKCEDQDIKNVARTRYLTSLECLFRYQLDIDKKQSKPIRLEISRVLKEGEIIVQKVKFSAYFILLFPQIYYIVHKIYDILVTPNWDPKV